ncbi:TPA: hypothetical protein ACVGJ5_005715 [Pseudomonas aeruginosa]
MRSLTLIPLLTSCIISPLCASQAFPNTQVTDGQLLARDFNRGGHSHVQKRANNPHNHAGKRQIRVHNYANEAVPFIVHGKKAFRGKHVKKDFVANGRRFKGSPTNSFSPGQAQQRPKMLFGKAQRFVAGTPNRQLVVFRQPVYINNGNGFQEKVLIHVFDPRQRAFIARQIQDP